MLLKKNYYRNDYIRVSVYPCTMVSDRVSCRGVHDDHVRDFTTFNGCLCPFVVFSPHLFVCFLGLDSVSHAPASLYRLSIEIFLYSLLLDVSQFVAT